METTKQFDWLDFIDRPAFCVKDGVVVASNAAAQNRLIRVGDDVRNIVTAHWDTYESFSNGSLFMTVTVGLVPCNTNITRTADGDVFILEQDSKDDQLQALALAAQQLRIPLSNIMALADTMQSKSKTKAEQQQATQLHRSLFQLLRIVSNMSDSGSYYDIPMVGMEITNITGLFREIMEKAQTISENTGIKLIYTESKEVVLTIADPEKLERAVYNILSNAIKFSPPGGTVDAKLSCNGKQIAFTVCNTCAEPVEEQHFWNRYRREPAIEDSRHGLGLGMTLIGAAATTHGGTVLVDHPDNQTTRVTMTLAVKKNDSNTVRSPVLRISDYAGGRDKALMEFAELLSADAYDNV